MQSISRPSGAMSEAHHLWHRLYRFFTSFQVELRGHYTVERIQALTKYLASTSTPRTLLIFVFSPLPCLLIVALVECVPLAPTEDGSRGNAVFWGRDLIAAALMMRAVLEQIRVAVPGLGMTPLQATVVAIIATTVSTAFMIGMASVIGFPLPFALVIGMPATMVVVILSFGILFGRLLKQDAELRKEMNSFSNVQNCPMLLMFVYPIYLYGFNRLGPLGQNMYVGLLPVIKIISKNWISYFLGNKYELMSQILIFNIDVFNAMYVSNCIQNSKSLSTTFISIALDALLAWVSMTDLRVMTKRVFLLRRKIPAKHPLKSASIVDIAVEIIKEDDRARVRLSNRRYSFGVAVFKKPDINDCSEVSTGRSAEVAPVVSPQVPRFSDLASDRALTGVETFNQLPDEHRKSQQYSLEGVLSEKERQRFVQRTTQVLFTAEFAILVLYTKFVVPFLFATCTCIMFYMPNHAYFPQLQGYDEGVLKAKVSNVALLGVSQFVLLLVNGFILQRRLGVRVLHLLAFGLDHGKVMVQTNLFLSIFYPIQNSLKHNGADFSLSFSWLKRKPTP